MPQLVASYSTAWLVMLMFKYDIAVGVEAVFKSVCSCFDCPIPARGQQFYQEMAEVRSVFHDVLNISLFI